MMMGYVDGEEEKMMTFNKQNQEDENRNSSLNAIDLNDDDKGGRVCNIIHWENGVNEQFP